MSRSEERARFIDRYDALRGVTLRIANELTPNGTQVFPWPLLTRSSISLGLDEVASLVWENESAHRRDHLIGVHLAMLESYLYRHGYVETGHFIRIQAGNYRVATEEVKQSIISNGFPIRVATVSSAEELEAATPLRRVSDGEYSQTYEKLSEAWGGLRQKEMAEAMEANLRSIHELLPRHKIGDDFRRERRERMEPLPLYVRNEIHHPTKGPLLQTEGFQQDKRIGYAIMKAWLSKDDARRSP